MAQDPDRDDQDEVQDDEDQLDLSHELDMVTLYQSSGVDSEIEAGMIRGVLDSNGIPSLLGRATGLPNFGFEVQVHRSNEVEARRLIDEALAAGPEAAAEAESASEETAGS